MEDRARAPLAHKTPPRRARGLTGASHDKVHASIEVPFQFDLPPCETTALLASLIETVKPAVLSLSPAVHQERDASV